MKQDIVLPFEIHVTETEINTCKEVYAGRSVLPLGSRLSRNNKQGEKRDNETTEPR